MNDSFVNFFIYQKKNMENFENNNFLSNYQPVEFLNTPNEWIKVKKQRKCMAIKVFSATQL